MKPVPAIDACRRLSRSLEAARGCLRAVRSGGRGALGSDARRKAGGMKPGVWLLLCAFGVASLLLCAPLAQAEVLLEYRLKAAFVYNFAMFTQWPATVGNTLNLCVHGPNPFGPELDALHGKAVGTRRIVVQRAGGIPIKDCQVLFIAAPAIGELPRVLQELRDSPVLTVADSPGAARAGVALNMAVTGNRITFEANPEAARAAHLVLSSKLLRLATKVHP